MQYQFEWKAVKNWYPKYSDKDILKNNLEKTDIATCLNM